HVIPIHGHARLLSDGASAQRRRYQRSPLRSPARPPNYAPGTSVAFSSGGRILMRKQSKSSRRAIAVCVAGAAALAGASVVPSVHADPRGDDAKATLEGSVVKVSGTCPSLR